MPHRFLRRTTLAAGAVLALSALAPAAQAQTNNWIFQYATQDDRPNGTGHNTAGVVALGPENDFVALVAQQGTPSAANARAGNYLVGYRSADSTHGRIHGAIYGSAEAASFQQRWESGLEEPVKMTRARVIAHSDATPTYVYVANNDADHNILVFEVQADTLASTEYRIATGSRPIWAIAADAAGNIYVAVDSSATGETDDIRVYEGVNSKTEWATDHVLAPTSTIDLPDNRKYRGLSVSSAGSIGSSVFVSDYTQRRVHKFSGSPLTGYTLNPAFTFQSAANDTIARTFDGVGNVVNPTVYPGPLGLSVRKSNPNLLAVAHDIYIPDRGGSSINVVSGQYYSYARVYLLDVTTGRAVDTLDAAAQSFAINGSYSNRSSDGKTGSYNSLYAVDWDEKDNLYDSDNFGWAIEKWSYDGDLDRLTTGVRQTSTAAPAGFTLRQNSPNPFNPTTAIDYQLASAGQVTLTVYDALGRTVATLVNERQTAGSYRATFDGSGLATGAYLYRLTVQTATGSQTTARRMMLVK